MKLECVPIYYRNDDSICGCGHASEYHYNGDMFRDGCLVVGCECDAFWTVRKKPGYKPKNWFECLLEDIKVWWRNR